MKSGLVKLVKCSWTNQVHQQDNFMHCYAIICLYSTSTRIFHELFMDNYCSWTVHVQFLKILHEQIMNFSSWSVREFQVQGQFMNCSWISVHEQFMYHPWKLFMNYSSWSIHELKVHELKDHELKQLHELGHFMFKDSSWTVHELVFMNSSCTILENCSWTIVHEIFMNSKFMNSKFMNLSNFMNLAISCSRIVHELFMNKCSWTVHVPFFKIVHEQIMNLSSWTVHAPFLKIVHEIQFMNCSCTILENCSWTNHEL